MYINRKKSRRRIEKRSWKWKRDREKFFFWWCCYSQRGGGGEEGGGWGWGGGGGGGVDGGGGRISCEWAKPVERMRAALPCLALPFLFLISHFFSSIFFFFFWFFFDFFKIFQQVFYFVLFCSLYSVPHLSVSLCLSLSLSVSLPLVSWLVEISCCSNVVLWLWVERLLRFESGERLVVAFHSRLLLAKCQLSSNRYGIDMASI